MVLKQLVVITTSLAHSLSLGEVQTLLKLNSLPQHPLSGRDVTLVTEREGWGLIYYKVRFYEPKIENCFKTVSSHTYHNAVITRNVSDEVIQLNDNYRLPRKFSEIFAKL